MKDTYKEIFHPFRRTWKLPIPNEGDGIILTALQNCTNSFAEE